MNHLLGLQHRRQYLVIILVITRYCLPDSHPIPYNPGTASRATTATLSTAFQADQRLRHSTNT